MRNSKTHSITLKRQLNKCKTIFYAFSELQYAYGGRLDNDSEIAEIRCNVKLLGCTEGDQYTTDFYCIKNSGEIMVRECVDKAKLLKPMTLRLLDASRNYWLAQGVEDWGIVLNAD
jgi:hypothetical protein